jgi:DNA primase large subunit
MPVDDLRTDPMMAHLMEALESGKDIGHYGRLVFAMVARHFMDEDELIEWLRKDQDVDDAKARALVHQVEGRDYSPPKRERVLQWMKEQEFPICPNADDPDACNVYKTLKFPDDVYEHIAEYREQKSQ